MTAVMCEKSNPTKPVGPLGLPVEPASPILASKYSLRTSRQMVPRSKPVETIPKRTGFVTKHNNHLNLSSSHGNLKTSNSTNPRFEVKTTLSNNTGRPRKMLSANFPSTVETLPLRNKVTLMKSSLSRSPLYKSPGDSSSAWSKQMNSTSKLTPTTPRVYVDCFDSANAVEHRNDFEGVLTKSYEAKSDNRTRNTNMGYREKCLQWLLTLPD